MSWDILKAETVESLQDMMDHYGATADRIINGVLRTEGAEEIKEKIADLLPESGRKWRKKKAAAKSVMPGKFVQIYGFLEVGIAARGNWGYLYFPDDGSNTERHAGNQHFMRRGADAATQRIIDICLGKLTEAIGG